MQAGCDSRSAGEHIRAGDPRKAVHLGDRAKPQGAAPASISSLHRSRQWLLFAGLWRVCMLVAAAGRCCVGRVCSDKLSGAKPGGASCISILRHHMHLQPPRHWRQCPL